MGEEVEPFQIAIGVDVLADLRSRLEETRWPADFADEPWQYGSDPAYLRALIAYWLHDYDWSRHERAMNGFHHFKTVIDGVPIHFLHEPGKGPAPMPLILSHGCHGPSGICRR